jgi:hypothetical protein
VEVEDEARRKVEERLFNCPLNIYVSIQPDTKAVSEFEH